MITLTDRQRDRQTHTHAHTYLQYIIISRAPAESAADKNDEIYYRTART